MDQIRQFLLEMIRWTNFDSFRGDLNCCDIYWKLRAFALNFMLLELWLSSFKLQCKCYFEFDFHDASRKCWKKKITIVSLREHEIKKFFFAKFLTMHHIIRILEVVIAKNHQKLWQIHWIFRFSLSISQGSSRTWIFPIAPNQ